MNEFRHLSIRDRTLDRSQAELWVLADATTVDSGTEIRGRLIGPMCPYAATIEVAYPLRPFRELPQGLPPLSRRVIIPEPSFWDPVSPFLYEGVVELWQDNQQCMSLPITHGLASVQLGGFGLQWNGRELRLSAIERTGLNATDLPTMRKLGINAVVAPTAAHHLFREAARLGFVVIGVVTSPEPALPGFVESAACLGWLLPFGWWNERERWHWWIAAAQKWRRFVGVEITAAGVLAQGPLPSEVNFVVGPHDLPAIGKPRLLRPRPDALPVDEPELGWVSP